jgi:RNA polymerase sigma-70 factor (ECF subfamily)
MRQAYIIESMETRASSLSDEEIIGRVTAGDVDAFEYLMQRYEARVFGIIGRRVPRVDLEEVAQDAFVRAYLSLPTYRRKGDFESWLATIAVRTCYDYWRERYKRREQPVSSLSEDQLKRLARAAADQSVRSNAGGEASREARELLAWAMGFLSPEDRAVLELVHLEERPVKEAADLLGWSAVNVKVRAYRSRKKLRAILEGLIAEEGVTS